MGKSTRGRDATRRRGMPSSVLYASGVVALATLISVLPTGLLPFLVGACLLLTSAVLLLSARPAGTEPVDACRAAAVVPLAPLPVQRDMIHAIR